MNMEMRRKEMAELINREGSIGFAQLKESFPTVSEMTLRRDLEYLDSTKQIVRTHGGAKSVEIVIGTDDLFLRRSTRNVEKKKLIAEKAARLIGPNTSIFLDSGTTITEFARIFPELPNMIFTSGISCALELARLSQLQVHLLGGQLNSFSLSVNGTRSLSYVENINFDIAFFGVTGYSKAKGFTCGVEEEYELKKAVMRRSETVVALMDATKVGKATTFSYAALEDVDIVVTDDSLDPETLEDFRRNGIQVI